MKPAPGAVKSGLVKVEVVVTPAAKRETISRSPDGTLRLRVLARPVEGRANAAVIIALSRALAVPQSRITIVHGKQGRRKLIQVAGLSRADLDARLTAVPPDQAPH